MTEPVYKKEYGQSSLVFEKGWADGSEYFQAQMLFENKVEGLLECSLHSFNGENQIFFDISGKQSLLCIYEKRQMKKCDLELLLFGIKKALENMREFLLDENYLLLKPEYIYLNLSAERFSLCFYPFEKGNFAKNMAELSEYVLERIDHEDNEAVVLAYQFYRLIREDNFSYMQIMEELFPMAGVTGDKEETRACDKEEDLFEEETGYNSQKETEEEIINTEKKPPEYLFYIAICVILIAVGYGGYTYYFSVIVIEDSIYDYITSGDFLFPAGIMLFGMVLWGFSFFFYRIGSHRQREQRSLEEIADRTCSDEFP